MEMDCEGEVSSACGSDGSPGTVNSPLIKTKKFYGQKDAVVAEVGYQSIRQKIQSLREEAQSKKDLEPVKIASKLKIKEKRNKNRRNSKPYSKGQQVRPKLQDKVLEKKKSDGSRLKIGKLISDRFVMKTENEKKVYAGDNLSSPLLLSETSSNSPSVNEIYDENNSTASIVEDETNFGEVQMNGKDQQFVENDEVSNEKCTNEFFLDDHKNNDYDTDSENEDCLLRYSSTANMECSDYISKDRDGCNSLESSGLDSSTENGPSDSESGGKAFSNEEFNELDGEESDSDTEKFDTSLCSIMDKSCGSKKTLINDIENQNVILIDRMDTNCLVDAKRSADQNVKGLDGTLNDNADDEKVVEDSSKTLSGSIANNDSILSKNSSLKVEKQITTENAHGLFKYFKKTAKVAQKKHVDKINADNSPCLSNNQKEIYRICANLRSPRNRQSPRSKRNSIFSQEVTIEDLANYAGFVPKKEPVSPSVHDVTNFPIQAKRAKKTSPKNGSKKFEQLYIDVGQKNFGHTTCPTCGMVYTKTLPEDTLQHSKYHQNLMQKLKFRGWKTERVLTEYHDGRVIQVNPGDNFIHLRKVSELREIVDNELGFAYAVAEHSDVEKVFLFISNKKIVGCAIAVPIQKAYPVLTSNDVSSPEKRSGAPSLSWCCSSEAVPVLCGISRIWVLKQARRQQVASRLIDHVRRYFIYGVEISKIQLAFSDPTPDGRIFAEKYSKTPNFLVFR